jgi:hypothetical protein
MTSRMEKKSVVKFAYVAHRETCRLYRPLHVCRWIFSLLSHRRLSLKILSTETASTENSVEPNEDVDVYLSFCEPSHSPEFYSADDSDSTPSHSV